jgi:hypothetical protein
MLLLVCAALVLLAQPARAQKPAAVEKVIFDSTNVFRQKTSREKFVREATLDKVAQGHAQAMARLNKYGDDDKDGHILDGKDVVARVKGSGYESVYLAENVGWNQGFRDPAAKMMKDWIGSPAHRVNLLNADVTQIGIGVARSKTGRWFFVQVFGRPRSQQTNLKVQIENQTNQTIQFRIGMKDYELKAGQKGMYGHFQPAGAIQIRISWPGADKPEVADLADKTRYALKEKKDGFEFARVGSL